MNKLFLLFIVAAWSPSQAALIDHGTFTTDTNSGLDWLDLSTTLGVSFDVALAQNPGWRYATNPEVEGLFFQLFPNFYETESSACGAIDLTCGLSDSALGSPDQNHRVEYFHALFGSSSTTPDKGFALGSYYDENNVLRVMGAYDYGSSTLVWGLSQSSVVSAEATAPALGTYLVRSTVVPIPAAAWLFASALAIAGVVRRNRLQGA